MAVAKDDKLDAALRTKVACGLVRDAIEAACHDIVLIRGMRAGRAMAETEASLERPTRLKQTLALAVLEDESRAGEVVGQLRQQYPRAQQVIDGVNRGVHGQQVAGSLPELVAEARTLIKRLPRP